MAKTQDKTKTYRVKWAIDVDAKSPKDAARQALVIQRDPESTATVFDVIRETDEHLSGDERRAKTTTIDLQKDTAEFTVTVVARYFDSGQTFVSAGTGKTKKEAIADAVAKSDAPDELDIISVFLGNHQDVS